MLDCLGDGLADLRQLPHLIRGECIEDNAAYRLDVPGGSLGEQVRALVGEDSELATLVGGVPAATDVPRLLQPGDGVGEPATRDLEALGQLGHGQGPVGRDGQAGEQVVVRFLG